jgi:tRNA modification GTPase
LPGVNKAGFKPTIYAFSTAAGRGAIAVLRVSGPAAGDAIRHLSGREPPKPRLAALRRIFRAGERIDEALVLWFPGPKSETGEDMAEFHLHGGRAISAAALAALAEVSGLRAAGPGDFTRQAFDNGRLDLTQAEAVADLVEAETAAQRRQALRQMDGALGQLYDGWRGRLLSSLAHLEAAIDFPEEDLPAHMVADLSSDIQWLQNEIILHIDDKHRGESLREGFSVAILGAPNAGKSSLLNALAGREAAIVSARAGTTRDVIETHLDIAGYPVILADTAGLRASHDEIEAEGVRRALARAAAADLKLILFDGAAWPAVDPQSETLIDDDALILVTKTDLVADLPSEPLISGRPALGVSLKTGAGMERLLARLEALAVERLSPGEAPALTRRRHREALEECRDCLARAASAAGPELMAEDLRLAARALGRITGRVGVEEILDRIFRDFCIGK